MMMGKKLVYANVKCGLSASLNNKFCYPQNNPLLLSSKSIKYLSTTCNQHSFTVSYLINSCGLSSKSALLVSKYVHFDNPERPDSAIEFFKNQGFSKLQISKVIRSLPKVLLSKTQKTLLPKIEFFHSKGISSPEIATIISAYPTILAYSLEDRLSPTFNFIKNFLQSDEKTVRSIKRSPRILCYDHETYLATNVNVLRNNGVPESSIVKLLLNYPQTFIIQKDAFNETVEKVKGWGFNPSKLSFVNAVRIKSAIRGSTWERKVDAYRQWGLSEVETRVAFRKHPLCMVISENKIMAKMDYFVNKMGLVSSALVKYPNLMSFSLEKRIVPRCFVIQVLLSKGLINRAGFATPLMASEKLFLERYVTQYEDQVPHLLKLYQEKMDLSNK